MFLNDDITRIFPPFTRLDFSRKRDFGGVGLGLAAPHSIVARHHEHIRVDGSKRHGNDLSYRNQQQNQVVNAAKRNVHWHFLLDLIPVRTPAHHHSKGRVFH